MAAIIFGLVAWIFKVGMQKSKAQLVKYLPNEWWRIVLGSILLSMVIYSFNAFDFAGLGLEKILNAYTTAAAPTDFVIKLLLTILTLSIGFKGGEVTPLFFIGATLGSGLSLFIPLPISFLAGMGMVAVFGAAAKTPLASAILAFELFGKEYIFYSFAICIIASFIAGKKSIYQYNQYELATNFFRK
jgi:H+/Cl- antiporter ClcA